MTDLTVRLARLMGVSEADCMHIRRGALLHDIGKMGIADGILLKPSPLSPEEWEITRRHLEYARELSASSSTFAPHSRSRIVITKSGTGPDILAV